MVLVRIEPYNARHLDEECTLDETSTYVVNSISKPLKPLFMCTSTLASIFLIVFLNARIEEKQIPLPFVYYVY